MNVLVVDYGMSNLGSITRALEEVGATVHVSDNPHQTIQAEKIVLPGVGSFSDGMRNLKDSGWAARLHQLVFDEHIPLLGICLGMQLLADVGYEGGQTDGLGFIHGTVEKLIPTSAAERLPHVGWNEIRKHADHPLLKGIADGSDFYFVHSYHVRVKNKNNVLASTDYCGGFSSIIYNDIIIGTQFHPEKSSPTGFTLLKNFLHL